MLHLKLRQQALTHPQHLQKMGALFLALVPLHLTSYNRRALCQGKCPMPLQEYTSEFEKSPMRLTTMQEQTPKKYARASSA